MAVKLHDRDMAFAGARAEIAAAVSKAVRDHELSFLEVMQILSDESRGWLNQEWKAVREESKNG